MNSTIAIPLVGSLVAIACALLGSFLVLRRVAMLADAIGHAILPGLVLGYFLAQGPNPIAGMLGAALAALITVTAVEALQATRRVAGDTAIGIVFPAMFALGTAIVSRYFANVHLDADAILYGNIEFVSLDALVLAGRNLGPQGVWVMGALVLANLAFVAALFKELKLATFDPGLAATLGFAPMGLHYLLMAMVSVTAVGAFSAVGAVLAVAFFIVPAATAYLLTERLPVMIGLAAALGAIAAVAGYAAALVLDCSVAGAMATATGVLFTAAVLVSPRRGLVVRAFRLRRQRLEFAVRTLAVHLLTHQGSPDESKESAMQHLSDELRWKPAFAAVVVDEAARAGWVRRTNGHLALTDEGRRAAEETERE